jgi:dsDNA-specific endonuclease/ATPase MutS2
MSRLNDPDNFVGRVNFAAAVISKGSRQTRNFDNCFENDDGHQVAAALMRRAEKNEKLAKNLFKYIDESMTREDYEVHKGKDLQEEARKARQRSREKFDAFMAETEAKRAAQSA